MSGTLFEVNTVSPSELLVSEYHVRGKTLVPDSFIRSVQKIGIVQPPIVRPEGENGELAIIDGVRRVRAAREAGLDTIRVIVTDIDDTDVLATSLTANMGVWSKPVSDSDEESSLMMLAVGESRETHAWETEYEEMKRVAYELGLRSDFDVFSDVFSTVPHVGDKTIANLVDEFESVSSVATASKDRLGSVSGVGEKTRSRLQNAAQKATEEHETVEIAWNVDNHESDG